MKTLKMMTDEELVVLYAEGNNAAFDILLNRYKSLSLIHISEPTRL